MGVVAEIPRDTSVASLIQARYVNISFNRIFFLISYSLFMFGNNLNIPDIISEKLSDGPKMGQTWAKHGPKMAQK